MKNITSLIALCMVFACNPKKPSTESSLELSNQEKVDATNIKQFFDAVMLHWK